ncbi:Predicted PurR-regulated permease PerM [Halogranum gelatinilyticum]|uniref:Predicted PurR-regulated permease PerM n=1 Tax=Halogranum gelatinilyticum TaxID=660521 RepID=A0A1G9SQS1_9EURY|nr:AI-2E family transporter [Halogranum gelatinilyticum]SDM37697.1 Predicted PurR-regulated permease PerM [Halogranum gelatinilyticum]
MSFLQFDRGRAAWWSLGFTLSAALLYVVYSFIGTFVFGIFIYYATRPIYRRLKTRIYPSSLAAAVSIFALALPAILLALYSLLVVLGEVSKLTNNTELDLSPYLTSYLGFDPTSVDGLNRIDPATLYESGLEEYVTFDVIDTLVANLASAVDTAAFVGVGLVHLFVMVAMAFYLLRDDGKVGSWLLRRFSDDEGVLDAYLAAVDSDLKSIFFGNILNAILTGTIGVIAFSILNVFAPAGVRIPAPALVGLLAGVASLIPVVGMKLVYVPVAGYMGVQAGLFVGPESLWFVVVFAAISFVVVDTIPDLVLRPYVSGRRLHVGSVMLAYTLGPLLFGWYGIFLLPMLLVFLVHFARIVLPELVAGKPIRPYVVDPVYLSDTQVAVGASETDGGRESAGDTDVESAVHSESASESAANSDTASESVANAESASESAADGSPDTSTTPSQRDER